MFAYDFGPEELTGADDALRRLPECSILIREADRKCRRMSICAVNVGIVLKHGSI
jgi:hypothetical protein